MRDHFRHLRDCFGCFTTGITIATTVTADGDAVGVTINSFSSVSLEPPLVLFSLDNSSSLLPIFKESRYFALNILTERQMHLSRNFAFSKADKWGGVAFSPGKKTGAPLIQGILAYLECEKETVYKAGDHHIFIGRVLECDKLSDENPLIYYKGTYRGIGAAL